MHSTGFLFNIYKLHHLNNSCFHYFPLISSWYQDSPLVRRPPGFCHLICKHCLKFSCFHQIPESYIWLLELMMAVWLFKMLYGQEQYHQHWLGILHTLCLFWLPDPLIPIFHQKLVTAIHHMLVALLALQFEETVVADNIKKHLLASNRVM